VTAPEIKPITKKLADFFTLLELPLSEIESYSDAYARLRAGEINGIMIGNVLEQDILSNLVERLEINEPAFLKTWFPEEFKSWFYGRNLNLTHPELNGYFEEAELFNRQLEELMPYEDGFVAHISNLLSSMDGGRKFMPAPGMEDTDEYMFATLRCHLEGGFIPPHIDYEYLRRRSYSHIRTLIDDHITSYVLALTSPENGGTLNIYDNRLVSNESVKAEEISQDFDIDNTESICVRIPAGAMFIFDSGRYLHSVAPVKGKQNRWTACSFMALSKEQDAMYCWG
jgi:hypothetical protein